jgi:hypothetical protein
LFENNDKIRKHIKLNNDESTLNKEEDEKSGKKSKSNKNDEY